MLILKTKITRPAIRSDILPRPRLFELLDKGLENRLILLSAPAGSGKTSLVTSWISTLPKDSSPIIAWMSVEESDNDPTRFWSYLVSALAESLPDVAETLQPQLSTPQLIDYATLLSTLLNLLAQVPSPVVMVLDDFQSIHAEAILQTLVFAINHLPANVHLLLLTRADPLLPLSRLRARGEMIELRASDLAFNFQETAQFVEEQQVQAFASEDLALVWERTEGWAAGLRMAFAAIRSAKNPAAALRSFTASQRFILDFFMDEVFQNLPGPTKDFLQKIAILDQLCGPLCDAVTGGKDSAQRLDALEQANLFITALDDGGAAGAFRWFRCHPLFRDLLQKQLRQAMPELDIQGLYRGAAGWYHQYARRLGAAKDAEEAMNIAVQYARQSGDTPHQAALIAEFAEALYGNGNFYTLTHWCADLPAEILQHYPDLSLFQAGSFFYSGQPEQALRMLEATERAIDASMPPAQQVKWQARASILRGMIAAKQGNMLDCFQYARQGMENLPETDALWRANGAYALANAYSALANRAETEKYLHQVIQISQTAGYRMLEVTATTRLALAYLEEGRLRLARQVCQDYLARETQQKTAQLPAQAQIMSMDAQVQCELGHLVEALKEARLAIEIAEKGGNLPAQSWAYLSILRVQISLRDFQGAWDTLSQANQLAARTQGRLWLENAYTGWKARLLIMQQRLDEARQLLEKQGITAEGPIAYTREVEHIALGRLMIAEGNYETAIRLLEQVRFSAEQRGLRAWSLAAMIPMALAFQAISKTAQALDVLNQVMQVVETEGAIQVMLDEGPAMARLLLEMQRSGQYAGLIQRLLPLFAENPSQAVAIPQPASESPAGALIEPLSERELAVLALLADGCSNAEIAQKLIVSLTTVKWHTTHIYAKLGVKSRVEAINRARLLGILPA